MPDSLPKHSAKSKPSVGKNNDRMTPDEEKAVAKSYREIKAGKAKTFKNADEYLKYLDTV